MDEINLKNFPQDIATTSNITKDTKVLIANGVNTYVTTLSAISKLLGVNSEKVESVSPSELPYLDTKNNRYMEVTETGDYYFEGVLLANNPRGYITIFWWDGDSWYLQSQYRVMGDSVEDATVNEDGDLIITYTDGVIANAGHVKGEKGDPLPYSEWSVEDVDKLIEDVNINAQRIPAITVGELPTPPQPDMYMVVTGVGAYTYGGTTIGTNADGYQTTFWWDGTAWSNNGSVRIKGTPNGKVVDGEIDAVSGDAVFNSAINFFQVENTIYQSLVNPYYRYISGEETTYTNNENQSVQDGVLTINIPQSGTGARAYIFPTEIEKSINLEFNFSIKRLQANSGIGIGLSNFFVARMHDGGIRKYTINTDTNEITTTILVNSASSTPLLVDDVVSFKIIDDNKIELFKNGEYEYTYTIVETVTSDNIVIGAYGHPYVEVSSTLLDQTFLDNLENIIDDLTIPSGEVKDGEVNTVSGDDIYKSAINLFETRDNIGLSLINPYYQFYNNVKTTFENNENEFLNGDILTINIPAQGSVGRAFQFPTNIATDNSILYDFKIKRLQATTGSGLGFENFVVARMHDGGIRKIVFNSDDTFTVTVLVPADSSTPLDVDDIITFKIIDRKIEIYKNGFKEYTYNIIETITDYNVVFGARGQPYIEIEAYEIDDTFKEKIKEITGNSASYTPNFYQKTGEVFYIYTHLKYNKYVRWRVAHEYNMDDLIYVDYWRLTNADIYELIDGVFNNTGLKAISTGESESVYRKAGGVDDATGGFHGDEILSEVNFYTDKGIIDKNETDIPLTECEEFFYIIKSTTHSTATDGVPVVGHPIESEHTKRTVFGSCFYETFNRYKWVLPITVSHWNIGISCIAKDVSTMAALEWDYEYVPMTGSETSGIKKTTNKRFNKYYGYNNENELSSYVESELVHGELPDSLGNPYELFIWDRIADSKYYKRSPSKTVVIDEVWESRMKVEIK